MPASPTTLSLESPTARSQLAFTPVSTSTEEPATPTLTPEPGLQTNGPYFAYFREMRGKYQLVMVDADGEGRKIVELPEGMTNSLPNKQYDLDMRYISPNGKWLAYYTGSAGNYGFGQGIGKGPFNLALNLLDLTTGESQVIPPLLSKDYPANFIEAASQLNIAEVTAESLQDAFLGGITKSIAWSPDGQHLAFAGQMDGLSSDLYAFDVETKVIRRLSSGDQELQWINWSPDGKWIIHSSVYSVGAGMSFDVYGASLDGSSLRYLSTNGLYTGIENWLNPHQYFEHDSQNVVGDHILRLVDIETGGISRIWEGSFLTYNYEANGRWAIVVGMTPDMIQPELGANPDFVPGPYVIDMMTLRRTKIEFPSDGIFLDYSIFPFGLGEQKFVLMGDASSSYFLSENLELTPLDINSAKISISPDSNFWIAVTNNATMVYSKDNELVGSMPLELQYAKITDLAWNPDSSGVFLLHDTDIYFANIFTSQINLIETNRITNHYGQRFKWIRN